MTQSPDIKQITRFFTAMGDPVRLQIVMLLRAGPRNVGEIANQFALSRPAISHHLRVLKDADIVENKKAGQESTTRWDKVYPTVKTQK